MLCLSVSLFGLFQVELDGKPVTGFESNKVRALLAYLIVEAERAHSREQLADLLWPKWPTQASLTNLRHVLASLRKTIGDGQTGPPFLDVTRNTIQFNRNSPHTLDVASFHSHLASASGDPAGWEPSTAAHVQAAVALYRGAFLNSLTSDSPVFEEWIRAQQDHLSREMQDSLRQLVAFHYARGDVEQALPFARRQLELEPWLEEAHQLLMRLLALSGQRSAALAQYDVCRRALKAELDVEPARETTALYESIRNETLKPGRAVHPGEEEAPESEPSAPGDPPYKGLSFFGAADEALFYGREALTAQLVERVQECISAAHGECRVLTVIGASGSGKSSIVRAGLIPALRRGGAPLALPFPPILRVLTPTTRPLQALALSLSRPADSAAAVTTLIRDLGRDSRSAHLTAARLAQQQETARVLLIVDQFEELFSECRDNAQRKAFVDNLLYAAEEDGPTTVIIVLRADFYAHCAPFDNLRRAVCQRQVYIGAMASDELRRAIEEPARRSRWSLESGLVDALLRDVGDEPGALPLLSHALLETWRRRRGRTLTLAGYEESGRVQGAIAKTAETTFTRLPPEQQAIARGIFLRLTELGEGTADTRRRATLAEIITRPEDAHQVRAVLQKLADARLVTTDRESAEVAHEALIREWATLREWLNENREGLRLHRHLTDAAIEWDKLNRDTGALYRGARLAQAIEWADSHADALNRLERAFIDVSVGEEQKWRNEELARQQRDLEAARTLGEAQRQRADAETRRAEEQAYAARKLRQRAVILALVSAVSAVLLLVALWLGYYANRNAELAQEQTRLATSRELAAAAVSNMQVDPERSVLLALQALSTANTQEASNALRQALPELHILHTIPAHRQAPGVTFSPDGTRLATIGIDGEAKVWDAASYQELLTLTAKPGDTGYSIAYSPDGTLLATAGVTQVSIWDATSGELLYSLPGTVVGIAVDRIQFSPDGKQLAVANMDGVPKVWDLSGRTVALTLEGHEQICDAVAYSPDGDRLASGDVAGIIEVWDAATGQEQIRLEHSGMIHGLAFSPDGSRLASASDDGRLILWDPVTGSQIFSAVSRSGLYDVAFTPDGSQLVTAHQDGTVTIWNAASGEQVRVLAGHVSTVITVSVSPDGEQIATSGYDGSVKLWETSPGREKMTLSAHIGPAYDVAYSPDGTQVATAGFDGAVRVRNAVSGQLVLSLVPDNIAGGLTSLAFSPDGERLAAASGNGVATVWSLTTRQALARIEGHTDAVFGLAFSPDGMRLVTASWDGIARVWDSVTGAQVVTFTGHGDHLVFGVAFSPDGKHVFTGGDDQVVREWDATTGAELRTYSGEGRDVYGVAISPDGKFLALGLHDGAISLWDTASGTKLRDLSGHSGLVVRLALSRDGAYLASASFDGLAKVWDVESGQEVATLYGNASNVFGVAFSPDNTLLATAGGDGTARVYVLPADALVDLALSRVTRSLDDEECQKYLHAVHCPTGE